MDSKRLEAVGQEIDRHLAQLLRPGGEIDTKVRKPAAEWLATEVVLDGAGLRVKMTLASWLTLVTKAHAAGWPKGPGEQIFAADDAKQFATALAKADLGPKWCPLVAAVMVVAMAGEFKVVIDANSQISTGHEFRIIDRITFRSGPLPVVLPPPTRVRPTLGTRTHP